MRVSVKQTVSWLLAVALVLPGAMIFSSPLEAGAVETSTRADSLPVEPVKVPAGETAEDFIKNPDQPDLYTLRNDYDVERYGNKEKNYQPYVATVGADATDDEKKKVKKTITLPDFAGYDKPKDGGNTIEKYDITYQGIVDAAKLGAKSGNPEYGFAYNALHEYLYKGASGSIQVRHVFQDLKDFSSYGKLPGKTDDIITTETGNVSDLVPVTPLAKEQRPGFKPESRSIKVLIAKNSITVDLRYNRDHFDATYDTVDGTPVPAHTLYYGQVIPPLADSDIPTKIGATLVGWKPSVNLQGTVNGTKTTFPAGQIMKDGSGNAIKKLDAKLIMPATNVKFTAVWEDRPRANYAIQFWTEKSDHAEDASLVDKYEFVSTRVYRDQPTGTRPNLAAEPVNNVVFPDLDQARLNKIWSGATFGPFLYLNKFYTYNKDLTNSENADPNAPGSVKPVSATGKTVYNIYFDRQVYDLYFTKSNSTNDTFYPEIWRHQTKLGWPGHPYHFNARFNQRLLDWPNDALETKGFSPDKQSFGWTPNYTSKSFEYRDTPPYRLTAEEFLDMKYYTERGGYTSDIDAGAGITIPANRNATPRTFTTLSFGIWESGSRDGNQAVPHHMDFWMDGFEENPGWHGGDPKEQYKKIIDYDLYRNKADTGSPSYRHPAPKVQGFTPYEGRVKSIPLDEDQLKAMNNERADITKLPSEEVESPYKYGDPHPKGYMPFMQTFFNRADPDWGDPADEDDPRFDTNGYIRFYYKRNKYPLRFNNDPATIKSDTDYATNEQTDIFYKKPLKDLNLNDVNSLSSLGLGGLLEKDSDGKNRIKRPEGLAPNMVFKGWALDPAGLKMVSTSDETMPAHALVLYAIWAEPDFKWKVTFDPDGGTLPDISETTVTQQRKTISEGDAGQGQKVTYPIKEANEGDKQVFTVLHRQKLVELLGDAKPTKDGYSFSAWEVLHYKKDANGNYTDEVDTSYHDEYGVPMLYGFGNDVVDPIYLKAIWVPDNLENVTVYHHFLDKEYRMATKVKPNPKSRIIENQRAGQLVQSTGSEQGGSWRLAAHDELVNSPDQELHSIYDEYNGRLGFDNNYFQMIKVEPKKITQNGHLVDNPNYKNNVFHFFYVPFRTRNYKVNYVDERAKAELAQANTAAEKQKIINKYRILNQERVDSEARHYDARNYKPIKGWKLTSDPQQQLFYDVDENTNKLIGINGTGSDEITFFYKDVRLLQVPSTGTTPEGYVRVTFKAGAGGSFGTDGAGNPIKELTYDVVEGTKSDQLPVPQELPSGASPVPGKYYVTPETNYSFARWDNNILLPAGTVLKKADENTYVFTAQFEKPPIVVTDGVVTTEAFTDPAGTWTNDFAPTLEALKGSIQQKENGVRTALPADATVKLFDENGSEITTDAAIYELVKENGKTDTEEPVRIIKLKAKVLFPNQTTRELTVPIRVYKNRYEATPSGDMPDELGRATTEPNGDLVNLLKDTTAKNYVKVTVNPTVELRHLEPKTYWVNPKAWVDIPEIEIDPSEKAASGFKHWTADQIAQNENKAAGGVYDFEKRHKFTADTIITPIFLGTPTPNPTTPPGPTPPGPTPPGPSPTPPEPTPTTPTPNPTTPGTPWTPTPGTPGGTPGTPTPTPTPSTPGGTPGTPTPTPTPSTPGGTPGTPGGTPAAPGGTPAAPGSPAAPTSPDQNDKSFLSKLPATGANSLLYLYAAVLFTLTGALVLRISRKRARD